MKPSSAKFYRRIEQRAFTLVELMMALSVGLVLSGAAVLLLVQTSLEQRRGYSAMTVEESAYTLQANITSCLRGMSSSLGMTPMNNVSDAYGNPTGSSSIIVFHSNSDGSTTQQKLGFNSNNGSAVYVPNNAFPSNQVVWMASGQKVVLRNLVFSGSMNPDMSANNSLVNVSFLMDDNGYSQRGLTNTILRNFSVQMRCD